MLPWIHLTTAAAPQGDLLHGATGNFLEITAHLCPAGRFRSPTKSRLRTLAEVNC